MNKIAVVSMIKNEEDIVESSVRHWALFADKIYIKDHKSTDKTRKILDSLKDEGLPLEISTYDKDEKDQAEVINQLLNQAFDEKFDLVLPLDADEFPIYIEGNSDDLRKYLQNLDTNQYYRVPLYECRFTDSNQDRFALARSVVKDPEISSIMPKVIACQDFLKNYPAKIAQGNHTLKFVGEKQEFVTESKIFYAHFSQRSREQLISKYMINRLTRTLQASRYTVWGHHGKLFVLKYLKDPNSLNIDINGFESMDLSAYRDEVALKFTGGGASILSAMYTSSQKVLQTLSIAKKFCRKEKSFGSFYSSMAM